MSSTTMNTESPPEVDPPNHIFPDSKPRDQHTNSNHLYQHRSLIDSLKHALMVTLDEHDALLPLLGVKREMLYAALDSFLYEAICRAQDIKNHDMDHLHQVLELKESLRRQHDVNHYYQSKLKEADKKLHQQNIQLLMATGKVKRREEELDQQREKFYKEVSVLKEMLYRKDSDDPNQSSRRQDRVELVNWEEELQKRGKSSEETEDDSLVPTASSARDQALEDLAKKYKQQIQSINRKHSIELDAIKNKTAEQIKKLEERIQEQQSYFDNFSNRMGDATAEVTNLNKKLSMVELEKSTLQRTIKELEKKIEDQQEVEVRLQGTISEKLNALKRLEAELREYKANGGYIVHRGEKINMQQAKEMIAESFRQSLSWKKNKERYNMELNRLHMLNEDLIMKFSRTSARFDQLQKQYEVKSAQLRDKTDTLNKLSSGDADYFRKMERECEQKTELAKELSEKILKLEALNMESNDKLREKHREMDSLKSDLKQTESSRQSLLSTIRDLEEELEAFKYREKELKTIVSELKGGKPIEVHESDNIAAGNRAISEVEVIEKMDVFRRLQRRHKMLDEKKRNQRNYLFRERQAQLERILDTAGNLKQIQDAEEASASADQVLRRSITAGDADQEELDSQNTGYWKDLRQFLSKEMEERQKRSDNQQVLANLLGPSSLSDISNASMQQELQRMITEEKQQKGLAASIPLSPRPNTARANLRKFSGHQSEEDTFKTPQHAAEGASQDEEGDAPTSAPPQLPTVPKLQTGALHSSSSLTKYFGSNTKKRPSTARIRKRNASSRTSRQTPHSKQNKVPNSDRPSRRYSAASVWRRKGNTSARKTATPQSARSSNSAAEHFAPRPPSGSSAGSSSSIGARRSATIQMPKPQLERNDSDFILQTSRQVRYDHNQRKKIIWEMQRRESGSNLLEGQVAGADSPLMAVSLKQHSQ